MLNRWLRGYRSLFAVKSGLASTPLMVLDEGAEQGNASRMDFVGAGVTATSDGTTATVTIPGSSLAVSDEGVPQGTANVLNVVGAGASIAVSLGVAVLTIPGSTSSIDDSLAISVCL